MNKSYISNPESNPTRIYDLTLLKRILAVQSKSSSYLKGGQDFDQEMSELIVNAVKDIATITKTKIDITKDHYGNIYVVKGKANSYPCVVSHIDTVHDIVKGRRVYQQNDILFCFSDDLKRQVGTGGDDKVGIFVNLQALLDFDNLKAVFYRNEETGHLGSTYSIKNERQFYYNCNFILQCDRKGSTDFLAASGGVKLCSEEFKTRVKPFTDKHGFNINNNGVSTDVDTLVREGVGISCANISSGYFDPHTDKETISVKDVGRTYSLVYDILENLGVTRFKYTCEKLYNFSSNWNKNKKHISTNNNTKTAKLGFGTSTITPVTNLPGMYTIMSPIRIPISDFKCPDCNAHTYISTITNKLMCPTCADKVETHYLDWHLNMIVTLTIAGRKKEYRFGMYDGAWVEKSNARFVKYKGLEFWTSKELYEERWKEKKV